MHTHALCFTAGMARLVRCVGNAASYSSRRRPSVMHRGLATVRYSKRGDPAEVLRCAILEMYSIHVLNDTPSRRLWPSVSRESVATVQTPINRPGVSFSSLRADTGEHVAKNCVTTSQAKQIFHFVSFLHMYC